MTRADTNKFERLYENYSAMLYGIAVKIPLPVSQANDLLITTFKKAHQQNIAAQNYPLHCVSLIKLLIETAQREIYDHTGKINFQLHLFKDYPVLHQFLCEQPLAGNDYKEKAGNREDTGKKLRTELLQIRLMAADQKFPVNNNKEASHSMK